ncbi:hypothetical protein NUW58_g10399 [Xylaria curta]|uniref:Uncharacterized protein n=1 Tax=Xylaria curta TaxID=42375 RepID=A0ACC1MLG7_9PEZI|nr:hypothetical protein NUW58_g10399 [Xylaria curta]
MSKPPPPQPQPFPFSTFPPSPRPAFLVAHKNETVAFNPRLRPTYYAIGYTSSSTIRPLHLLNTIATALAHCTAEFAHQADSVALGLSSGPQPQTSAAQSGNLRQRIDQRNITPKLKRRYDADAVGALVVRLVAPTCTRLQPSLFASPPASPPTSPHTTLARFSARVARFNLC